MKKKLLTIFILFILILSGCKKEVNRVIQRPCKSQGVIVAKKANITVWVHGTRLLPSWLFSNFFYSAKGLHPAISYDKKYHLYTIAKTLDETDPQQFPFEYFYFFGWSGKLSKKEREEAGKQLKQQLNLLLQDLSKKDIVPSLTIITHSHGGNVVLHMADCEGDLLIDRLILLACPVQRATSGFINHPMFKHIYSFYSGSDAVQIIDPQGVQHKSAEPKKRTPLFSERCFPESPTLRQKKVTFGRRGLFHIEFVLPTFLSLLPQLLSELETAGIHVLKK